MLAIGPLVDTAIIRLENTHRHLGLGALEAEAQAAFLGASEVALPELVASCVRSSCSRLCFMLGWGEFLSRPMFLAVAFAMVNCLYPIADLRAQPPRQLDPPSRPQNLRKRRATPTTNIAIRTRHHRRVVGSRPLATKNGSLPSTGAF